MCGWKHRIADRMEVRTGFAKGIDEVAVVTLIKKMAWMLTLFGVIFHAMVNVCRKWKGSHDDQVCIISPYDLHDVANFEADVLYLATTI
jgi:hypothetical protein